VKDLDPIEGRACGPVALRHGRQPGSGGDVLLVGDAVGPEDVACRWLH